MNADIYIYGKKTRMSLLMNNATKELSLTSPDENWVTIHIDIENLKAIRDLIDEKLSLVNRNMEKTK